MTLVYFVIVLMYSILNSVFEFKMNFFEVMLLSYVTVGVIILDNIRDVVYAKNQLKP